ncbi:MAG: insulinase family protein, partial [Myxococcota bacterium]
AHFGIDGYAVDTAAYLRLLSRAIRRPRCGPQSFAARRNATIHSLEEFELSDPAVFQLFVNQAAFGAGHPYARPVFGTIGTLKELNLRAIQDRQKALLNPASSTLLIVGDVHPPSVMSAVRDTFGPWVRRRHVRPRPLRPPRIRRTRRALVVPRRPAASMLVCATRNLTEISSDHDAGLRVLTQLVGAGLDSRLGTGLRMKTGLSYGFSADLLERRHGRALVACTQVRSGDADRALQIFRAELEGFAESTVTEDELRRAKRQINAQSAVRQASGALGVWLEALALGHERPRPPLDIDRITGAEIQQLALRVFDPTRLRYLLGGEAKSARRAAKAAGLPGVQRVKLDL